MANLMNTLWVELARTVRNPGRLRFVFDRDKLHKKISLEIMQMRVDTKWSENGDRGIYTREYTSYERYLEHQRHKLPYLDLREYDSRFREVLRERLQQTGIDWPGKIVICLAARTGTEVKAFLDISAFAVGIDLNPGPENRYVLYGDFHDIRFATGSADVVFTNSMDHVFDVDKVLDQVKRVLKPRGYFLVEAARGMEEGRNPEFYESFWWKSVDDLIDILVHHGFTIVFRQPFTIPWQGEQFLLRTGQEV